MDPLTLALKGGGMALDLFKEAGRATEARRNAAYQREAIARAAADAISGRADAMRLAGSLRQDQFGNATYYDPTQGRWVTYYTPTQRALIEGGEQRQARAQARGAQASQDYDTLRGEYLYRRPKSEAESYAELVRLIQQAQGEGERALNTLTGRWGTRTAGNLPELVQFGGGPSPGQQLAETMLQARKAALEEYGNREKVHQSRYLPALKQFEETANYVAPLDPTGSTITGMTQQGLSDMLKYGSEYDKLLATIEASGARTGGTGSTGGGGASFANSLGDLAKLLQGNKEKTPTSLGTQGARVTGGGDSSDGIGGHDLRFNYGPTTRGAGGEAAGLGSIWPPGESNDPFDVGTGGFAYGSPYTKDAYSYDPSGSYAMNPFGNIWQF